MKKYTLGYIFTPDLQKVLLVHKIDPEWQRGKLNGIGGKNKENETDMNCIIREVEEETSLKTQKKDWIFLGKMHGTNWTMSLFTIVFESKPELAKQAGKEKIEWFSVSELPSNIIPNLKWQIPLAIEKILYNALIKFDMEYEEVIG